MVKRNKSLRVSEMIGDLEICFSQLSRSTLLSTKTSTLALKDLARRH